MAIIKQSYDTVTITIDNSGRRCTDAHETVIAWDSPLQILGGLLSSNVGDPENIRSGNTWDIWSNQDEIAVQNGELTWLSAQEWPYSYVAIYGHNLGSTGSRITAFLDNVQVATTIPLNDDALLLSFEEVKANELKITVETDGSEPFYISHLGAGQAWKQVMLKPGFESIFNGQHYEQKNNISESGHVLGRTLRKVPIKTDLTLDKEYYPFFKDRVRPWLHWAQKYPFFVQWSNNHHPDEVAFCQTDGIVKGSNFKDVLYNSMQIPMICMIK